MTKGSISILICFLLLLATTYNGLGQHRVDSNFLKIVVDSCKQNKNGEIEYYVRVMHCAGIPLPKLIEIAPRNEKHQKTFAGHYDLQRLEVDQYNPVLHKGYYSLKPDSGYTTLLDCSHFRSFTGYTSNSMVYTPGSYRLRIVMYLSNFCPGCEDLCSEWFEFSIE
jgi:hypothetical protein